MLPESIQPEIVVEHHGEPMTTSLAIAEGVQLEHAAVIKLVRRYVEDLDSFGRVGFEIQPFDTAGGRQYREIAWLNEQQATFLLTLMRNSPVVIEFKKALVREFFALRDRVRASGPSPAPRATILSSNPNHVADQLTSADRIFRSILRASRAAGVPLPRALRRANEVVMDRIGLDMLNEIQAEDVVTETHIAAIDPIQVHEFCDAWLGGDLPLPVVPCRSEDLYAAWVHWRRQQGHGTAPLPRVVSVWTRRTDVDHRRMRYEGQDGRVLMSGIIVPECERHPPPPATQRDWITQRVREFAAALEAWRTAPE